VAELLEDAMSAGTALDSSGRRLSPQRTVLVVNRFAGRVRHRAIARLARHFGLEDAAVLEVGRDGSARAIAEQLVAERVPLVLAAGGDGTLHQMLQAFAGSDAILAPVPLGTSNDLARQVGIPTDLKRWLTAMRHMMPVPLDLLRMGRTYVATVGGLGLPAHVAEDCRRLKQGRARRAAQALGGAIYSMLTVARVGRYGPRAVTAVLQYDDGPERHLPVSALLVGTAARFGGGLRLCEDGALRAGRFAAIVVTATTRQGIVDTLLRLRSGRPLGRHAHRFVNLRRMTFRTDALVGAFGDGEWMGMRHRLTVRVDCGAVQIAVPASAAAARSALEVTA
jgi:diacylglycerol kinase (ATP)